jgi:hypothetical protein
MAINAPNTIALEAALDDLGISWVLVGDPFTAAGMSVLGLTPSVRMSMNPEFQERTYEEYFRQPLDVKLAGYQPEVEIELIWGDPAVYAKVNPSGATAGGHTSPQDVTYTTMVVVPQRELANGWTYTAGTGTPPTGGVWVSPENGPKHAVWIPKGYFEGSFPEFQSLVSNQTNARGSITYRGVLADDPRWPEGTKSWVIGDPAAHGVAHLAI